MPKIEMNLTDYLRVIRKRKWIIILCFVLIVASTAYYTFQQTPIYRTACKVKIEQRKSVAEILTELITWSSADALASQASMIVSFQVMEKVAERLNLVNSDTDPEARSARTARLQGQVQTERVEDTNIISISVVSSNPEEAMTIANTVAEVYVETHFENKKLEAKNVMQFVEDQMDGYFKELQESEEALLMFKQENPLVTDRESGYVSRAQVNPRVSSINSEIAKLEMQLISLKSKYTENHPDVIAIRRSLAEARKDLSGILGRLSSQQKDLSGKEVKLAQLNRNKSIAEEMYMTFKKRHAEAQVLEAEKAKDVTIVEPASMPNRPIEPDFNFNIMIGVLSGFLIGLIMAFVAESFDTSIGRIDEIEELIKLPVVGVIPHISLEKGKKSIRISKKKEKIDEKELRSRRLVTLFEPTSVVAEAYRSMRTHLDYSGMKEKGSSIVITSASPDEGKTQTIINLGTAFAQDGRKVLLVSTDFRKPVIHDVFGLNRSPGLSEVLIGRISSDKAINTFTDMLLAGFEFDQILQARGIENLNILTSGGHAPNPAELLNFPEMGDLIQDLKQKYDVVLLDTPPILPVADACVLSTKTDGVILIYQAGRTPRQALIRAKAQLENVNAKVLGVVINNVKADYIQDLSSYYKYQYYSYKKEKEK